MFFNTRVRTGFMLPFIIIGYRKVTLCKHASITIILHA